MLNYTIIFNKYKKLAPLYDNSETFKNALDKYEIYLDKYKSLKHTNYKNKLDDIIEVLEFIVKLEKNE